MKKIAFYATLAVASISNLSPLSADTFNYVSQSRSVTASINAEDAATQTLSANDFGEFNQTARAGTATTNGHAYQHEDSILGSDSITVSGDFTGQFPTFAGTGAARGETVTDVMFNVSNSTSASFTLTGHAVDVNNNASITRTVQLSGPGVDVSWSPRNQASFNFSQAVTLTPGQYHLFVNLQSFRGYQSNITQLSDFNLQLTVPEPVSCAMLGLGALGLLMRRRNAVA